MRPTKTLELPISKIKVELAVYWTLDEYLEIEAAQYQSAKSVSIVDGQPVTQIDGKAFHESTNIAMTLAVKKMTAADGTDIPVTRAALGELHADDGILIRDAVEAVEGGSKKK